VDIRATDGEVVHGMGIVPHTRMTSYGEEAIALTGCTIRLRTAGAASIPLELTDSFHALPNLTRLVAGLATLGDPSAEVVLDQDSKQSTCYFDIDFGTFSACYGNGAVTTLEVESSRWKSRPGTVPLRAGQLRSFPVRSFRSPTLTALRFPAARATSSIFCCTTRWPARMPHLPQVPHTFPLLRCSRDDPTGTVGAGCSNSNYP
jgi:hypothetical protein